MVGANVVSGLFNRFPALLYIGSAVIAYTGVDLIHKDAFLNRLFPVLHEPWVLPVMGVLAVVVTIGLGMLGQARARRQDAAELEEMRAEGASR
jgi:predicted tellurium resistance membrane protein TerC